ncbi:DNA processing protein [Defluviimonas denitrificans]|uniref:DNA processing protein n=1 Tax=Albidovulum denitrificans TaxID=404881 RepID=A0A2S8S983_9RHOB|nr:DNA-processing protein DprA [Defluviimonas denitrificans]PQV57391.1 DNA processing protein [Defluviimonas denitrificans]
MFSYPTPFTPPTTEDDRLSWLRLIRSRRVGVVTFWRLLAEHGSAQAALKALPGVARSAGVSDYAVCPEHVIHAECKAGKAAGARLICRGEPAYPQALADLSDAPPVLWIKGDAAVLDRPMVALVGARSASALGTRIARKLAGDLGEAGITVVSGLARGIDTAAHLAALGTGTVAVMAGGVDVVYPPENAALAGDIGREGLLLSEQQMGLDPMARHFPLRNRLISGLSRGVLVIEAAAKSGSLITARLALDQGREVLAVPGHPFDARASGCNMLIRDGAVLVRSAEDVIEALGLASGDAVDRTADEGAATGDATPPVDAPVMAAGRRPRMERRDATPLATLHDQILQRLGPSPVAEDQLIRDLGLPTSKIAPVLVSLELEGQILRQPGGLLSRMN